MSTTLSIPRQNLTLQTEMLYPVEYRQEKPLVPKVFIQLVEQKTAKGLGGDKSAMFADYAKELQTIEQYHGQLRAFMDDVCECNLVTEIQREVVASSGTDLDRLCSQEVIPRKIYKQLWIKIDAGNSPLPVKFDLRGKKEFKAALEQHLKHHLKELPDLSFHTPNTGRAELAAHPDPQVVKTALEDTLKKCWAYLIWMTLQSFDYLTSQEMMGVIEWHASDVARYNFFTGTWMERQVRQRTETHHDREEQTNGTQHTRYTKIERDMERTYTLTRHTHDVIDAKPVSPSTVEMPPNARRTANRVPDYLKDMVQVVTGKLVFQQEIEEEILKEEWTVRENNEERWFESNRVLYHPDPALIIGHYVITGWV